MFSLVVSSILGPFFVCLYRLWARSAIVTLADMICPQGIIFNILILVISVKATLYYCSRFSA